jgi:DNA helicase HerA-like ATPase
MTPDRTSHNETDALAERRQQDPRGRLLGRVVACSGARATISAVSENGDTSLAELWSVGKLISISVGESRIVALVYSMKTPAAGWAGETDNVLHFEVELLGEIRNDTGGRPRFSAGIANYPYLGAIAHRIRTSDLAAIYETDHANSAVIGRLTQDESMPAAIHIPSLLDRHFAIVGTTGVGKSTAVSLLLNKAIQACPDLRVLILDPHNEFAAAFPDTSIVIETDTLDLPFWLFKLEEFTEVLFRGRVAIAEEIDVLRELIPEAKRAFRGALEIGGFRRTTDRSSLTADTPVPYRMADLLALIDERIGRLEGRNEKPHLRSLKQRVIMAINDPRFHFMFSSNTINDTIVETMSHIFRIPGNGRPITAFQLAGIPSEVVNSVASVLCRMAFEIALWGNGGIRLLLLCEEAHRYVPADPNLGFIPTRQSIARIAKEGRKYGISLGVVTQRPGELDPTILSQCSTVFAMRLANDRDQEIIRSAIADSSSSTTSFLSSIGNGEAIAFGEAVPVPMRMMFERVPEATLPRAATGTKTKEKTEVSLDLRAVVQKMRNISPSETAALGIAAPTVSLPQAGDPFETAAGTTYRNDGLAGFPADLMRGNGSLAPQPGDNAAPHLDTSRPAALEAALQRLRSAPSLDMDRARSETRPREPAPAARPSLFKKPPTLR